MRSSINEENFGNALAENRIDLKHYSNKRAMMALNRSPESVSPQNEFYLLYYYCSNL